MENLVEFLRQRNVPEETIELLECEKIDVSVIELMTDEQLKKYFPSYGDRLAVLAFCRRKTTESSNRKSKLFERLKSKISQKRKCDDDPVTSQQRTTKNAQKSMRKIEMGWMNYDESEDTFKQVRTRKGGGTRKVHVSKDSQKSDLIQEAIQLFFGDGKNTLGDITDFEVDLKNYKDLSVDEHTTVGKLYAETKLPILRFYLTTKKKKHSVSDVEEDLAVTGQELDISSPTEEGTGDPDVVYIGSNAESDVSFLYSTELTSSNLEVNILEDSNIVTLFTEDIINFGDQSLDDTLPLSPVNNTHPEKTKRILVVHRGHVLPELIAHFSDESVLENDIQIQHIAPDGKLERGHDEGGVVRDCLAEFWNEFYDQCTLGSSFKVPFLRHDFGQQHWESVGRIIVFGWQKEKYLPVKIAPVIMEQVASGCVKSNIVENFLKYVSEPERIVFQTWQSDFNSVDKDELLEVLDVHSCRKMPTENNAEEVLQELAHKKLIQEPAYVIEQWANIFANAVIRIEDISSMYENLQPTVRKVVRALSLPENMNAQQKEIQRYLTNYLRESSTQGLCRFLRFCTGSDLLVGKTITVNFTEVQGFQRRPISHTCGCVLELSVCYDSYPDFRSEMNKIMESNVWVMDII